MENKSNTSAVFNTLKTRIFDYSIHHDYNTFITELNDNYYAFITELKSKLSLIVERTQ